MKTEAVHVFNIINKFSEFSDASHNSKMVIIFLNIQLAIQWLDQVTSWSYWSLKVQYDLMEIFIKIANAKKRPIGQQNHKCFHRQPLYHLSIYLSGLMHEIWTIWV